jgi:FdhD protein
MAEAHRHYRFSRQSPDGGAEEIEREIAVEMPVAVEFNGIGYAVMMATPADLDDFAYGFARAERLIDRAEQVIAVEQHRTDKGLILRITLSADCVDLIGERVRHRVAESSCGLCGIENLEQAMRPLRAVTAKNTAPVSALFAALQAVGSQQHLNSTTGAVHAAALCAVDGQIRLIREDVGRHNAFDKLTGAMLRAGLDWDGGFALTTARCSYELVEKAILANCPLLAAISAPTSLAIDRAKQAGLALIVLARSDAVLLA